MVPRVYVVNLIISLAILVLGACVDAMLALADLISKKGLSDKIPDSGIDNSYLLLKSHLTF